MHSNNFRYLSQSRTCLRSIGIPVICHPSTTPDPPSSFAVGCWIDRGVINYVPKRCLVGSLIHEAGHLALSPRASWRSIQPGCFTNQPQLIPDPFGGAGELAVEAWGYAFAVRAKIPIEAAVHSLTKLVTVADGELLPISECADTNQHGYFNELSYGEFAICRKLLEGNHIGIKLLKLSGFTTTYPKLDRWLWGDRVSDFDFKSLGELKLC